MLMSSCENNINVVNNITGINNQTQPVESSKDVEFLYSDSAQIHTKLNTPLVNHYMGKKPYYEMPEGMNVVFYDKFHKEQTKLTAKYGIGYDTDNKMNVMEAKRNVVVVNEKGDQLNTEHLTWNSITKKIYTDEFVKITTKDEVIWGDGLESNEDFSDYQIKHVKGEIDVKDAPKKK